MPSFVRLSLSGGEQLEKAREAFVNAVAQETAAIDELEKAQEAIKSLPGVVSMHRNLSRSLYERAPQLQKKYADDSQKELDAAKTYRKLMTMQIKPMIMLLILGCTDRQKQGTIG